MHSVVHNFRICPSMIEWRLPLLACGSVRRCSNCIGGRSSGGCCSSLEAAAEKLVQNGVVTLPAALGPELLRAINKLARARVGRVMKALGDKPIGIGSRQGYAEVVQRSRNRFDVPLSEEELLPTAPAPLPWIELVRLVLGPEATSTFSGIVFSRPGSPNQQWHIDSPHEGATHLPMHALNVLVALEDVSLEAGPTEVASNTHRLTNHLRSPWLNRDDLLYQSCEEITPAALHAAEGDGGEGDGGEGEEGSREGEAFSGSHSGGGGGGGGTSSSSSDALHSYAMPMKAGDALVFDDRILHRGLANNSKAERWVAYFSYCRPREGEIEDTHFGGVRSLFDDDATFQQQSSKNG